MSAAISVKNLSKSFRAASGPSTVKSLFVNWWRPKKPRPRKTVLDNISFEVGSGEFFGIAGSNGSGKSTLLKLLAGIYQADSGTIKLSGPVTPLIEIGAGLQPELSGRDNLYLGASFIGLSRADTDRIYEEVVEFAGLDGEMDKKLKNYSSGMQVRLAFSLMTRGRGDIILVDEVLAVGDEDFQNKCWDYLDTIKKQGKTVVLVTHDMEALAKHCQRAILINDKKITAQGPAPEVAAAYHQLFAKPQKG